MLLDLLQSEIGSVWLAAVACSLADLRVRVIHRPLDDDVWHGVLHDTAYSSARRRILLRFSSVLTMHTGSVLPWPGVTTVLDLALPFACKLCTPASSSFWIENNIAERRLPRPVYPTPSNNGTCGTLDQLPALSARLDVRLQLFLIQGCLVHVVSIAPRGF